MIFMNTSAFRALIIIDYDGCIFIETDVGTISTAQSFFRTNDNSFYNVAFLDNAAGCCIFNSTGDNITDVTIFSVRTTHDLDAEYFFRTRVIGNIQHSFLLNHGLTS